LGIGSVPAEPVCTVCHAGNALNSGGQLQILGVPDVYFPDTVYDLTVQLTSSQNAGFPNRKWGFELTAVRGDDGSGAGTLLPPDGTMQTVSGSGSFAGRTYIEHTSSGTHTGQTSPVTWQFQWKAPSVQAARIYFFAAGNAANGNGANTGDFIYTTRDSVDLGPVAVASPERPLATRLLLAQPNPAHGRATLRFDLARPGPVSLALYDPSGRRVRSLANQWLDPGQHAYPWDGSDDGGRPVPAGVYFVRLAAPGATSIDRIVLLH
jgi:hypothetical protein